MAVVTTVLGSLWIGPSYALVQSLSGPALRATAAAIFMMVVNIVGLGLGPVIHFVLAMRTVEGDMAEAEGTNPPH